jgi:hypothetical protein
MSNINGIGKPEDLAGDLSRRDAEWAKWESEIVQLIIDDLQPLLLANYPGSGWFEIIYRDAWRTERPVGFRSAFGQDLKRLFAALDATYNRAGWQLRGESYAGDIYFYFRPLRGSSVIMDCLSFGSIKAGASIVRLSPQWPTQPGHHRPNLRSMKSAVSGVVLKPGLPEASSTKQFIYEQFC